MPRQRSEAAAYLDIYKLAIEKERLEQELLALDQRRSQIHERLAALAVQMGEREKSAQPTPAPLALRTPSQGTPGYNTLFFEY